MTSSTIRMDSISKLSRNLFSTRDDTVYHEKHPIDYLATYIVSYEPRTGVYTTSLNDGSLGLLENLNINHSLSTIYTNNPEQFANIDGTEISINKSLRDHISTKYQKHFEGGSWDIGGRWDEATTYGFLKEISKDMKLKILFSEKIQLLRVKRGTLNGGMNQIELILQQLNRRD